MQRRDFIKSAGALVLGSSLTAASASAAPAKSVKSGKGRVRFCAFADIHYFPGYWPHGNRQFLETILDRADREKTDFVIHLGDFAHNPVKDRDYVDVYNNFKQPTYHVLGNHDGERSTYEGMLEAFRMKSNFYHFDCNGFRFIVGDSNYFIADGKHYRYLGYEMYRGLNDKVTSYCRLPPEQVEWLRRTIDESPHPCVFLSHASVERTNSIENWKEIRKIFADANRKNPGRVRMVINGHHHTDYVNVIDDIVYFDVNSASYQYYDETHDFYPPSWIKHHLNSTHSIAWNDPLSAVVTLDASGDIRIDGSESTFFMNVTPRMAERVGFKPSDRPTVPYIRDFEFHKRFGA